MAVMKRPVRRAFSLLAAWLIAAALGCGSGQLVTIRAGRMLDGLGGERRDVVITITGSTIRAIAPWQGEAVTHDLSARTVLPGLIDGHVHIAGILDKQHRPGWAGMTDAEIDSARAEVGMATLRAGFTTVVSLGSELDFAIRRDLRRGKYPGPRLLTSFEPIRDTARTPLELRRQIRQHRGRGADLIKVSGSRSVYAGGGPLWRPEQLAAICQEARRATLRTVVHAHGDSALEAVAAAGCDQVEHGFLATADGIAALARAGVVFDPQCGMLLDNYLANRSTWEGLPNFSAREYVLLTELHRARTLAGVTRIALATPGLGQVYGSDAGSGMHGRNGEDLICRVREAGQAPMEALVTATSRTARAYGLGEEIGTLAPGYQADLIALDGNPLEEIEAVRRVVFVMRAGRVLIDRDPLRPDGSGRILP